MNPVLGTNLDNVTDWNTSQFFTNIAMQARAFGNPQTPWDGKAALGADGWPTQDFGACYITGGKLAGAYKLVATGKCNVASASNAVVMNQAYNPATNTTTADVVTVAGGNLYLSFTNTGGTLKNVRLYAPGYNESSPMFTSQFVDALKPFNPIRCMDFTQTNGNPVAKWADRTKLTDPTQAGPKGALWEVVVALANQTGKDIWINVPHLADDDYVTNLAKLLKATLKDGINVYLEYSNEVWNNQFVQTADNYQAAKVEVAAGEKTLSLDGTDPNEWYWGFRRVAKKICRISDIFAGVWGKSPRIRPVLATKLDQPTFLSMQLEYIEHYHGPVSDRIYACAGAPYYGVTPATEHNPAATVDQIISELDARCTYPRTDLAAFHSLAKGYGIKAIAYEGGVDLGQDAANSADELAAKIKNKVASHYDPRMKAITAKYLNAAYAGGFDAFVYYELAYMPNAHGHWGLTDDVLDLSQPKYQGAVQVANAATPANEAGLPLGTITFGSLAFQSGFNASKQPNGDMLYIQSPERFYFLIRADADGVYPMSIIHSSWEPVSVEVMANGATATYSLPDTKGVFTETNLGTVALRKGVNGVAFKAAKCNLRSFTIAPVVAPPVKPNIPPAKKPVLILYDDHTWEAVSP